MKIAPSPEAGGVADPKADPRADPKAALAVPPTLAKLLAAHASQTDPDSAFARLFALWGARYIAGNVDPCTQALQQGLECFVQKGSLAQLRLYNRPAILMLSDDGGASHQVVLSGLDDEQARIDLDGAHAVPIAELSRYWFGDFVLLWRPQIPHPKPLSLGMRGEEVRQLRERLDRLNGVHIGAQDSDVFDAGLAQRVREFQRTHRLTVDGVAGVQTLVVLNSATAEPHTPLLLAANVHGS